MNNMDRLQEALKTLRETDADREASSAVEARLRAQFRAHHAAPPRGFRWRWVAAAAASLVVAAFGWKASRLPVIQAPEPPSISATVELTPQAVSPQVPAVRPVKRKAAPQVVAARVAKTPPTRLEFLPLPYAPPMLAEDQGQVIRVRLPRQSIRRLGFPVNEELVVDRIPADILMGEDGVARGIRFVRAGDMR